MAVGEHTRTRSSDRHHFDFRHAIWLLPLLSVVAIVGLPTACR